MLEAQDTTGSLSVPLMGTWIPEIVISGGQVGADMGGLLGARDLCIATGGVAPKGWKTERGPNPTLADYGLEESPYNDYTYRTEANVKLADVTVAVARYHESAGTALTRELAVYRHHKPYFEVWYPALQYLFNPDAIDELKRWLLHHKPCIVNIAGNRESKAPGIQEWTRDFIRKVFS